MTIRENLSQPVFEETGLLTNYLFPVINIGVCDLCFLKNSATGLNGGDQSEHYKV